MRFKFNYNIKKFYEKAKGFGRFPFKRQSGDVASQGQYIIQCCIALDSSFLVGDAFELHEMSQRYEKNKLERSASFDLLIYALMYKIQNIKKIKHLANA